MTIAAKHFDPQLGIDIHTYLIPPSPIPIPLPTPHIGIVLDPFDYLPFIGGTVHVNGLKRATAGTGGLDIHIPVGGVWMPPLKIAAGPQWDDELFMGSKTVLADGDPFSKITMPVLACNIVGMIAPFRIRKPKKPHMSLLLPTTFNIAIPTNVFVGGPPTVSWTALAMGAGLSIFGKILKKTGIAGAAGAAFKKLRQKVFGNMKPGFLKCKVLRAEPVDIRDGSVSVTHEDFAIPGRLPLTWTREYRSTDTHAGQCGHGWHTPADVRLALDADGSVLFHGPDMPALFPHLPQGEGIEHAVREFVDGARLIREGHELWVRTKDGLRYGFAAGPANLTALHARVLPIERIEDLCGNYWRFERGNGQLVRIVESGIDGLQGRFLEIDSRHGRIDRVQLHDPATGLNYPLVSYRYQDGDLTAALDALDAARTFEYRQHRMVRHTDRVGLSFHYAYDAQWRVVRAWGDGGLHDYKFRYDDLLEETEITDSLGYVSIVKFDENGLPLCEIDPLDGVTVFEYDEVGRTTAVVDPMGLRMEFAYDERGNVLRFTRPDGSSIEAVYDENDRAVRIIDPVSGEWSQAFDDHGLIIDRIDPQDGKTAFSHDSAGQLTLQQNPVGGRIALEYDRHGALEAVVDALGQKCLYEHDARGCLLSDRDPIGRVTRYGYDAKGRLVSIVGSDGTRVACDYDAESRLLQHVDEAGATTRMTYSGTGQVSRRVLPDGSSIGYRYDTEERLVELINQRGETYRIDIDARGYIEREIDYWGQARCYRYDAAGRMTSTLDPSGKEIHFSTDAMGRIVRRTMPDPYQASKTVVESFRYDKRGLILEMHNPSRQVKRRFDSLGQLIEEKQDGFVVNYRYDAIGNVIERATSAGNRVAYSYDLMGEVALVSINDAPPIVMERDQLGRLVSERLGDGLRKKFAYEDRDLLSANSVMRENLPLFETAYEYDSVGNMVARYDNRQGADKYIFDPVGRLLEHVDPAGHIDRFLYDRGGDRLSTRVRGLESKRIAGSDVDSVDEWIREGELEGVAFGFDRSGNLVRRSGHGKPGSGEARFRWDANHRLIESLRDGSVTTYGYDAIGRRVFKRKDDRTTWFFWDGDALLSELVEMDTTVPAVGSSAQIVSFIEAKRKRDARHALYGQAREYVYYPGSFIPLALIAGAADVIPDALPEKTPVPELASNISPSSHLATVEAPRRIFPQQSVQSFGGMGRLVLGEGVTGGQVAVPEVLKRAVSPTAIQEARTCVDESPPVDACAIAQSSLGAGALGGMCLSDQTNAHDSKPDSGDARHARSEALPVLAGPVPQPKTVVISLNEPTLVADGLSANGTIYYYHVDPNGCPTRLTDARGAVVWSARQSAWGVSLEDSGQSIENPLRFQGQYADTETGLHYNRYRYYDPSAGQYISQDPIRLGGGLNLYAYGHNPLDWSDPFGLTGTPRQGGTHGQVRGDHVGQGGEVNHVPAYASYKNRTYNGKPVPGHSAGPAMLMEYDDHRLTKSCSSSHAAKRYRAAQTALISQGKWARALEMDIRDIQKQFPGKYSEGLRQAVDTSLAKGLISAEEAADLKIKCG